MTIRNPKTSLLEDYPYWLLLAGEVEPLFGSMVDDPGFQEGLKLAIQEERAICIMSDCEEHSGPILGGVILDFDRNEVLWLAVAGSARSQGIGRTLLENALHRLDPARPILVQTYDKTVAAGLPARTLYTRMGFVDIETGGLNPAGLPTVIMQRLPEQQSSQYCASPHR